MIDRINRTGYILSMHEIDWLGIDGKLLETFVAVIEEVSVSKAALRLSTNQSTVSHRLDRLRAIVGDELIVRAGRGITPTMRAQELVVIAREILEHLMTMARPRSFAVSDMTDNFVVAATDYERALFLGDAAKAMLTQAPMLEVSLVWDRYDNGDALRRGEFDVALSPMISSSEAELRRCALFDDHYLCFFDPRMRAAPATRAEYLEARHARIIFSRYDNSLVDSALAAQGLKRQISLDLPSLKELPDALMGTDLIATIPSRLKDNVMRELASSVVPFELPSLTFRLFWHPRTHASPKHIWLRSHIIDAARRNVAALNGI